MKTITIAEGITATLTNHTYNAMCEYYALQEKYSSWYESTYEERDWGDMAYYDETMREIEDKYSWLWE